MSTTSRRIAVSAASGLVGSELVRAISARGDAPAALVRRAAVAARGEVAWDPGARTLDAGALAGISAMVHLSGEPIASGRWTRAKKALIRDSRIDSTRFLCEQLAALKQPPAALVSASAIGFYGSRGDETLDENSAAGEGFLAEVCEDWEAATAPARDAGIRVVNLRIGIVLSSKGGALAKMLTPFRLGLGGPLGDGRMWMSWIVLRDLVGAILHAIDTPGLHGPVNGTAPSPVTNADFTRALGRALHRPAILPAPAFAISAALGEMGRELLLSSAKVLPRQLQGSGFRFAYDEIGAALSAVAAGKE